MGETLQVHLLIHVLFAVENMDLFKAKFFKIGRVQAFLKYKYFLFHIDKLFNNLWIGADKFPPDKQ